MTSGYHCWRCGEPIDPLSVSTGRRTVGWEFKSQRPNGGSDIKLREPLTGFIHLSCVEKIRLGVVAEHQESLL